MVEEDRDEGEFPVTTHDSRLTLTSPVVND